MHLSMYTDYALRALIYVALKPEGELSTIKEISDAYGISKNHMMKIVNQLAANGFVDSVRGRTGGIRLARSAQEIVVGNVVRVTESDFRIAECFSPDGAAACCLTPACLLRPALAEALSAFITVLDDYTLADITKPRRSLAALLDLPAPPAPPPSAAPAQAG
jgi:Rrf2 family transcriptional regulator, nitric oxide-sensitive transcriptional repressor